MTGGKPNTNFLTIKISKVKVKISKIKLQMQRNLLKLIFRILSTMRFKMKTS